MPYIVDTNAGQWPVATLELATSLRALLGGFIRQAGE